MVWLLNNHMDFTCDSHMDFYNEVYLCTENVKVV